ncbi:hypothetical protein HY949_02685 [Candidatus Gottesmanbacteria bacterium]|nr:hypothetical protein [Candidatus Gottesmanbacteria bacterium]
MLDKPDLSEIDVPHVLRPDVNLGQEYERVLKELSRFRQELIEADDPLFADQIIIEESAVHVRYNPNDPRSMQSAKPVGGELKTDFSFLYGVYGDQGGYSGRAFAMRGLQDFKITPSGDLSVLRYDRGDHKKYLWSPYEPTLPEALNEALVGLVRQHDELIANRQTNLALGVVVPQLTKA